MKKHLIAAAVAAAVAVPAAAQVTITGNMDIAQTQSKTTVTNATDTTTGNNVANRTQETKSKGIEGNGGNSPYSSSMIKLDATEDLGGGLKAIATHEISLNNSGTGAAANNSFGGNRQSFVGISGTAIGTLTIGYQYAHEHNVLNGAGNAGTNNTVGTMQNSNVLGKTTRHDMIQWVSPKFGGLEIIGQWGDEGQSDQRTNDAPDRTANESDFMSLGANYATGALTLRGGYSQTDRQLAQRTSPVLAAAATTNTAGTFVNVLGVPLQLATIAATAAGDVDFDVKSDESAFYLGGNYNMGSVQLFANFADRDAKLTGTIERARIQEGKIETRSYDVGARVSVGATMLWASLGDGEVKTAFAGVPDYQADVDGYQLGAYYALSKRTGIYALHGNQKVSETTAAEPNKQQVKTNVSAIGVRHSF